MTWKLYLWKCAWTIEGKENENRGKEMKNCKKKKTNEKEAFPNWSLRGLQEGCTVPSSVLPIVTCNKTLWISKCLSIYKHCSKSCVRDKRERRRRRPKGKARVIVCSHLLCWWMDFWSKGSAGQQGWLSRTRCVRSCRGATATAHCGRCGRRRIHWGLQLQWKGKDGHTLGRCRHWVLKG